MRLTLRFKSQRTSDVEAHVIEIVTPRTNVAALTSAENFFTSLALDEPFAMEMAADRDRRRFLVRASGSSMCQQLMSQLGAAYPQADFRRLQALDDPARAREDEQVAACTLCLRAPAYLPLRTFTDLDVDGDRSAQADPVLGILSALGDLPTGWRGLSQLVLLPAPENWCTDYQRFSVQHPLEHERVPTSTQSTMPMLGFVTMCLVVAVAGLQAYSLLRAGQWLQLASLFCISVLGLAAGVAMVRRLSRPTLYDMELVREKVTRAACRAEIRLLLYAPSSVPQARVRAQLQRIAAVYRRFNLAAANGLVPHQARPDRVCPWLPAPSESTRRMAVLTTLELAGLWHLPHATADVVLLERTTARRWLPLPTAVAEGCRIGTSRHQGRDVAVALPLDVLRRHMLLVAKTRRGKSTLMLRLAQHAMQAEPRRAVLLVDPHRDLAEAALGLVPEWRSTDVVYLDVANLTRPFGLNLLDTGLGWDRDRAVANTLAVFEREWGDRYWGPRMEDAFRFSLMTLFDANLAYCQSDPSHGRSTQYTLLEVPALLSDAGFRRQVLQTATDPAIRAWWSDYFDSLDRRLQMEVINPVLSKIHKFEGLAAGRYVVGQPASTIDPAGWLREGAIVIVNTGRGVVGESAAALIGSTLLNLVTLAVAEQAGLESAARWPISIFVDEFHTLPGADYEGILTELSKYGANLVLATQSLSRLLALGGDEARGLRATVFANLDGLFAFNCSAEDAEYLVPELGGLIDDQDLVELGEHQCYVRLSSAGQRVPTFSVQLDPPLTHDPGRSAALAGASAERFGRDAKLVQNDRQSALARVLEARTIVQPIAVTEPIANAPARNEHRPRKKRRQARPEAASAA